MEVVFYLNVNPIMPFALHYVRVIGISDGVERAYGRPKASDIS